MAKKPQPSLLQQTAIGDGNVQVAGDHNTVTVNQTIIQKFFNIFKSDAETLEQRNRRILLNHVENAWIKGVLDASLHGAALLELGIKQDPEAVTQYPWTLKKESTHETLPAGTSMLEIFDSIGMGRSLLILGAPGSGKTTMLLELARGLIARAREDVTQPIPMVFNLSSWTESKTLADWLAQELNNLYSVPRKTAPDWVKGNKLLLLLDGLDEVRQESRAKCVEAINEFREQNGLTSLAVCSRSQDYSDLKATLSFEGAIEVQPLTQGQITEFFNRIEDEMAGIKQALEKDSGLREMAETPLFLNIMLMAYRGKRDVEISVAGDENAQRRHLFDYYIQHMFEWRSKNVRFKKQDVLHWLSWLACTMVEYNQIPYVIGRMQAKWLNEGGCYEKKIYLKRIHLLNEWENEKKFNPLFAETDAHRFQRQYLEILQSERKSRKPMRQFKLVCGIVWGLIFELLLGLIWLIGWWNKIDLNFSFLPLWILFFGVLGVLLGWHEGNDTHFPNNDFLPNNIGLMIFELIGVILGGLLGGLFGGVLGMLLVFLLCMLLRFKQDEQNLDNQHVILILVFLFVNQFTELFTQGRFLFRRFAFRITLVSCNLLPWRLVPFLNHCVDLIFLRRVGGGYIFIHRLLMEHFAEMYVESPTSKGN